MGVRKLAAVVCLGLTAALVAKAPKNAFVFRISAPIRPENVQVRYFLTGKFGGVGGWQSYEGEDAVWISTDYKGTPAAALKAVLFAPACEPERVTADDLRSGPREYSFQCRPAPTTPLRGSFERPPEWRTLRVEVHVDYIAPWANQFFGIADGAVTTIGVGEAAADASGQFTVNLPVTGKDGGTPDGAFSLILREGTSGNVLGVLHPPEPLSSAYGMKAASEYPSPIRFALERNR